MSWIEVVVSAQDGVVICIDQYHGVKTQHKPELDHDQAYARALDFVTGSVLPDYENVIRWRLTCSEHPEAYVWQVPGSSGDYLVFSCSVVVRYALNEHATLTGSVKFSIDAATGYPITFDSSPTRKWQYPERDNGK